MTKKKMDVLRTTMLLTIYQELADKTIEMLLGCIKAPYPMKNLRICLKLLLMMLKKFNHSLTQKTKL
jgi:hypothetical protein